SDDEIDSTPDENVQPIHGELRRQSRNRAGRLVDDHISVVATSQRRSHHLSQARGFSEDSLSTGIVNQHPADGFVWLNAYFLQRCQAAKRLGQLTGAFGAKPSEPRSSRGSRRWPNRANLPALRTQWCLPTSAPRRGRYRGRSEGFVERLARWRRRER